MEKENNKMPEFVASKLSHMELSFKHRFQWTQGDYQLVRVAYNEKFQNASYVVLDRHDTIVATFIVDFIIGHNHPLFLFHADSHGGFLERIPLMESWLEFLKDIKFAEEIKEID